MVASLSNLKATLEILFPPFFVENFKDIVRVQASSPFLVLGQTHVNGWSHVIVSQNRDLTNYIFPFRLRVLQWSRHLLNYWNK